MAQPTLPVKPAALHGRVSLRHARRQVDPASVARLIRCANIANNGKSLYQLPVWFVGQLRFRTAKPVQPTFFCRFGARGSVSRQFQFASRTGSAMRTRTST